MKVKDLIEQLRKIPGNRDILVNYDGEYCLSPKVSPYPALVSDSKNKSHHVAMICLSGEGESHPWILEEDPEFDGDPEED